MQDEKKGEQLKLNNTLEAIAGYLSKLNNAKTRPEELERLSNLYKNIHATNQQLLDIMPNENKKLVSATRLECGANGILHIFAEHCIMLRTTSSDEKRKKTREQFSSIRLLILEIQKNMGNTDEEDILIQKMTIFLRALIVQTLIFAGAPQSQIISAIIYCMCDVEKYSNFARLKNLASSHTVKVAAEHFDPYIREISANFSRYIVRCDTGFSEHDKMFVRYLTSCPEKSLALVSPQSFANALLSFDDGGLAEHMRYAIAKALTASRPIRDGTVMLAAHILGQIKFVQLQLTGIFHQKDVITAETKAALLERLKKHLPLLKAYSYFTGHSTEFGFLGKCNPLKFDASIIDKKAYLINISRDFTRLDHFPTLCTFFTFCLNLRQTDPDVTGILKAFTENTIGFVCKIELECIQKITSSVELYDSGLIDYYQQRKSAILRNPKIPNKKIEYYLLASLLLFTAYRVIKLNPDSMKEDAGDLLLSLRKHLSKLRIDPKTTDPIEKLVIQTLRLFTLTMLADITILLKKSATDIMNAVMHFLVEYGIHEKLMLQERLCAQRNPSQQALLDTAIDLCNQWNPCIVTIMSQTTTYVQQHEHFSENDKQLIAFIDACAVLPADMGKQIPDFVQRFASHLLHFDTDTFAQKIRRAIARQIPDPSIAEDALILGQMQILYLKLTGIFTGKKYVASKDEEALTRKLEESASLLNAYRYFLRLYDFHYLDATLVNARGEARERLVAFQRLAELAVLTDTEARSSKIAEICHVIAPTTRVATNASLALMCFVTEEAEKERLPKIPIDVCSIGNPLVIEALRVLSMLLDNPEEDSNIRNMRPYLSKVARDFSVLKKDFYAMVMFFLICKKALKFHDVAFTTEIQKMLTAYAKNKKNILVFAEEDTLQNIAAKIEITPATHPEKKKSKKKKNKQKHKQKKQSQDTEEQSQDTEAQSVRLILIELAVAHEHIPPPQDIEIPPPYRVHRPKISRATYDHTDEPSHARVISIVTTHTIETPPITMDEIDRLIPTASTPLTAHMTPNLPTTPRVYRIHGESAELGVYLHAHVKPDDFEVQPSREAKKLFSFFNKTASRQNNFQNALFLFGSAVFSRNPNDRDFKINGPLEEARKQLEKDKKNLGIILIELVGVRYPILRVRFFSHSSQIIEISSMHNANSNDLLTLIVANQGLLDWQPNTLFYTEAGHCQFLIDSQNALDALRQKPISLHRVKCEHSAENTVLVYLRGIKFLSTYESTLDETERSWFEQRKDCLDHKLALEALVKLLYSGRAAKIVAWLMFFNALQELCEPLCRLDTGWLTNFDAEHSLGFRVQAKKSTENYWQVLYDILAIFLSPFQSEIDLNNIRLLKNHPAARFEIQKRWNETAAAFFPSAQQQDVSCYTRPTTTQGSEINGKNF